MPSFKMFPHFAPTFTFIQKCLKQGNVLIHCQTGNGLSATLLISYIMRKYSVGAQGALALVKRRRNVPNPNKGFMAQLLQYEHTLNLKGNGQGVGAHCEGQGDRGVSGGRVPVGETGLKERKDVGEMRVQGYRRKTKSSLGVYLSAQEIKEKLDGVLKSKKANLRTKTCNPE